MQAPNKKASPFSFHRCVFYLSPLSLISKWILRSRTFISSHVVIAGLLIFRAVAEPRISSKSAKSREIHKNTRNPAKFARKLTKYMSARHIWKLSSLLGLLTRFKLANLPWNFVTAASKQHPKSNRCSCIKGAFIWDQSGIRIIGIMRVSVCLGAILIPEYLDFHSGYSTPGAE